MLRCCCCCWAHYCLCFCHRSLFSPPFSHHCDRILIRMCCLLWRYSNIVPFFSVIFITIIILCLSLRMVSHLSLWIFVQYSKWYFVPCRVFHSIVYMYRANFGACSKYQFVKFVHTHTQRPKSLLPLANNCKYFTYKSSWRWCASISFLLWRRHCADIGKAYSKRAIECLKPKNRKE